MNKMKEIIITIYIKEEIMSILSKTLPSSACLSCLPAFKKLMAVPTVITTVIKLIEVTPKIIAKGKEVQKQVTSAISVITESKMPAEKGGET